MSDATAAVQDSPEAVGEYLQAWAAGCSQVLSKVSGTPVELQYAAQAPAEMPVATPDDLHFTVVATGALRGEMVVRAPRPVVRSLARVILKEAQDAEEFKAEHGAAAEDWLRQVAGEVAGLLRARWGEVQLAVQAGDPPSWSPGATGWISSSSGASLPVVMELQLSAALIAALRPAAAAAEASPVPGQPTPALGEAAPERNLDMLMAVELNVTLRFGKRQMLLRDILNLNSGSVIELDRRVNDPADLLLDGKLIAHAEVVVVNGNYGLRITEIVASSPGENTASPLAQAAASAPG